MHDPDKLIKKFYKALDTVLSTMSHKEFTLLDYQEKQDLKKIILPLYSKYEREEE